MSVSFDPKFIKFSVSAGVDTLDNGIIGYWKLDDNSATQTDEVSTNDLTVTGATYYSSDSKLVRAIDFTGSTNTLSLDPVTMTLGATAFSVSMWIKADSLPAVDCCLFGTQDTSYAPIQMFFLYSSGNIESLVYNTSATDYYASSNTAPISTGTYYHLVFIHRGNGLAGKVFVDAADVTNAPDTFSGSTSTAVQWIVVGNNFSSDTAFDGRIDEVGIWNRVLTQAEIEALYNSGSGKAYSTF